jgi:hypothetical protein
MSKFNVQNKYTGSLLDDFLKEEGLYDEVISQVKEKSGVQKRGIYTKK